METTIRTYVQAVGIINDTLYSYNATAGVCEASPDTFIKIRSYADVYLVCKTVAAAAMMRPISLAQSNVEGFIVVRATTLLACVLASLGLGWIALPQSRSGCVNRVASEVFYARGNRINGGCYTLFVNF